jgi:putative GTP pyrophosphokinase
MASPDLDRVLARYAESHPDLVASASRFLDLVKAILDEAGINYLAVTGRAKTVESFAGKALRRDSEGELVHPDPLHSITDQVGLRVVTYVRSDVDAVAGLLAEELTVLDDRDMGRETARAGRFGYASRHLLVSLDPASADGTPPPYEPQRCASIQLRTVLQHAWAEFEHEIRYKGTVLPEHGPELDRRFTLAAGLLELADREFTVIRDTVAADMGGHGHDVPPDDDPRISAQELATFLAGRYASAGWSRTDHYGWIAGILLELGIASLDELSDVLRPVDSASVTAQMEYRYPPGAVRRLDDDLLMRFLQRYVELPGNANRREALATRLAKLTTD